MTAQGWEYKDLWKEALGSFSSCRGPSLALLLQFPKPRSLGEVCSLHQLAEN